jgi:F-type H+-transporting ATPase subunit b
MQEFLKLLSLRDILLHMINVLILFIAIRVLAYKPIRKFLDGRAQRVAAELDEAARKQAEADQRQRQLEADAQQAKIEAAQAVASGVQQGQRTGEEILARAHAQADEILAQAREEARQIKLEAKEAVRAQAINMAVEIAGRLLEREVNPEDHRKIIDEFLTKVG